VGDSAVTRASRRHPPKIGGYLGLGVLGRNREAMPAFVERAAKEDNYGLVIRESWKD
jgi:hypothetical protein